MREKSESIKKYKFPVIKTVRDIQYSIGNIANTIITY